jgi:arylsulfatase A-like enzyme
MFINFIEPHGPYWPPEPFRSRFLPPDVSGDEVRSVARLESVDECIDIRVGALKLSEREWRIEKALYDGCTATLDDRIGKLFSYLDEKGFADETLIIITSDHGDVQGEHPPHVEHHLCAYDELIRVPLIIRYPKAVPRAVKVRWITQTHDILPTILDILGVKDNEYWKTLQGVSLMPSITDDKPVREYALVEYSKSVQQFFLIWRRHPDFDIRRFNYRIKALRNLKYKYIWYSNGMDELYDLERDPGETNNIASDKLDIVERMRLDLEKMLLSIEIVDYGDLPALPRRISRFGEAAKREYDRLRAWGFYRDIKPAKLPKDEDMII